MSGNNTVMAIPKDTLRRLRERADKNYRSPQKELEAILDTIDALEMTGALSYLPAPKDANPVPVITTSS